MTRAGVATSQAYLYGLAPAGLVVPPGLSGVAGAVVETVPLHGVQLVVSRVEPDRFGLASDLLAHSTVLDRLAVAGGVVPMAVGTFVPVPPDHAAEGRLTAAYRHAWPRVEGAVQYSLSARYLQEVVVAELVQEDREIARLRELTRRNPALQAALVRLGERIVGGMQRKAEADSTRLRRDLPRVRELRIRPREQPDVVLEAMLLVDRDAASELETRMEQVAARYADRMRLRLLGPQAPYEFVSGG